MGIQVGSNFDLQTALPLDSRTVVADLTARDAITTGLRYEGLEVYVESEEKNYQLIGGTGNLNWVEGATASASGGFTISGTQSVPSGGAGQINLNSSIQQMLKVQGTGGAVTTANAPFSSTPADGTLITLIGKSATNTVTIPYADVAGGCLLKGPRTLGLNDSLTLIYDATDDRYYDSGRNS